MNPAGALREAVGRRVAEEGWWFPLLFPGVPLYYLGWLLWHLSWKFRTPYRPAVWTLGVGNLTVGGTGKTPFVAFLASYLRLRGLRVAIVSRGYGRKGSRILRVQSHHSPRDVGDEPWMLHEKLADVDVWVGKNRVAIFQKHLRACDVAILDDAFQYRAIRPHVSFLLFDARTLQAPRILLPAGGFREPFSQAHRADAFIVNHKAAPVDLSLEAPLQWFGRPVFHVRYTGLFFRHPASGTVIPLEEWREPVYAFCGIADPAGFVQVFHRARIPLRGIRVFMDHHFYTPGELEELRKWAGNAPIVTTEKDWVRFREPWENLWVLVPQMEEVTSRGQRLTDYLESKKEFQLLTSKEASRENRRG